MTLTDALEAFNANLDEIIEAMSANLTDEMEAEKVRTYVLGSNWVADEVRRLQFDYIFGDRIKRLRRIVRYKNALTNPTIGTITEKQIQSAREHPITDIFEGKLHKKGKRCWGVCPFHTEKTASFMVDTNTNHWHCFGCNTGGDGIAFYMRYNNKKFIPTIKALCN